ncbi:branched-chain amino acid transport system ATP-binding protein [Nocardioides sp. BE266]|uniref:ABC transporter ATP-binding protein n=1 Tax=Nocardioides sp. BE266 TaxID=2817725 RepID=UPI002856CA47|nr:ABC transporter ATP-binding protein [Nocardioides sp. BE266]MDR7255084.1 branched-chain amino acid transport system ATP-binding protein [Nocardioides sp. BE266]
MSLHVEPGEVVALLGANGAGKTTTLRTISRLHPIASGEVYLGDTSISALSADQIARRGVAHVPEGRRLYGTMTVQENLEMGLFPVWGRGPLDLGPAFELFPELERLRGRAAYSLSGGEQQMVAIARALLPKPVIVMMDEPSLGLAPVIVDRIIDTIGVLKERGVGVLLVEQDTEVALACADRGYVLANGHVTFEGTAADLQGSQLLKDSYLGL